MMELTALQQQMQQILPDCNMRFFEPMAAHTSLRIGGNAEIMAFPKNEEELCALLKLSALTGCKYYILGAGTNVLAPDEGLSGIVICMKDCLESMEDLGDHRIRVSAGVSMTRAAVFAANLGLSGLEFAHGIPGSVGGGVYMNAGAYGGEISQVCQGVTAMTPHGKVVKYSADELDFSYRHSRLEETGEIVLSAEFQLVPKPADEIKDTMKQLMAKRSASQPLDLPSAGSAFKRPENGYAAALIDEAGLKGFQCGNAQISTKHAGFAVNLGGATAKDMTQLLQSVSDKVFENSKIRLVPEIRIWR